MFILSWYKTNQKIKTVFRKLLMHVTLFLGIRECSAFSCVTQAFFLRLFRNVNCILVITPLLLDDFVYFVACYFWKRLGLGIIDEWKSRLIFVFLKRHKGLILRMATAALGHPPLPLLRLLFVLLRKRKVGLLGLFILWV